MDLADVDGDGVLDLIGADAILEKDLFVLTGLGDGTFAPPAIYPLGGMAAIQPGWAKGVDADADGDVDVLAAAAGTNLQFGEVRLHLNDGTGALSWVTVSSGEAYHDALAGDLNGDGLADVVEGLGIGLITFYEDDNVTRVQLALAGGGFQATAEFPLEVPVALVDLDGDGDLDLRTDHLIDGTLVTRYGAGDGSLLAGPVLALGPAARALRVAHLDGDGLLDVVVAEYVETPDPDLETGVRFVRGGGDGHFGVAPPAHVTLGQDWTVPESHALADFDGDGRVDVVGLETGGIAVVRASLNRTYAPEGPLLDLGHQLKGDEAWPIQVVEGGFLGGDEVEVSLSGLPQPGACVLVVGALTARAPTPRLAVTASRAARLAWQAPAGGRRAPGRGP